MNFKNVFDTYSGSNTDKVLFFFVIFSFPGSMLPFLYNALSPTLIATTLFSTLIGLFALTTLVKRHFKTKVILGSLSLIATIYGIALFRGFFYIASRSYRGELIRKFESQSTLKPEILRLQETGQLYIKHSNNLSTSIKSSIKKVLNLIFPKKFPYKEKFLGLNITFKEYGSTEGLLNEIFVQNTYYFQTNTKNPVIVDAGSNIGISVLYFKKLYPGAKIIAFEPDKTAFELLEENVKNNNFKDVVLHHKALSDTDGLISFYSGSSGSVVNSIFPNFCPSLKHKQKVLSTKLSRYINTKVDLLKIDTEGAEEMIIEDLVKHGKMHHIQKIIMEYHHHVNPDIDRMSKMFKMLEDNNFGYHIGFVMPMPYEKNLQTLIISAYRKDIPTKA